MGVKALFAHSTCPSPSISSACSAVVLSSACAGAARNAAPKSAKMNEIRMNGTLLKVSLIRQTGLLIDNDLCIVITKPRQLGQRRIGICDTVIGSAANAVKLLSVAGDRRDIEVASGRETRFEPRRVHRAGEGAYLNIQMRNRRDRNLLHLPGRLRIGWLGDRSRQSRCW